MTIINGTGAVQRKTMCTKKHTVVATTLLDHTEAVTAISSCCVQLALMLSSIHDSIKCT